MKKISFIFLFIGHYMLLPAQGEATVTSVQKGNWDAWHDAVYTHSSCVNHAHRAESDGTLGSLTQEEEGRYSKKSIACLKQYHTYVTMRNLCYDLLPKGIGKKKYCMLEVWQYVFLLAMGFIILLTHRFLPYLFHALLYRCIGQRAEQYYVVRRILFIYILLFYLSISLRIFPFQIIERFINPVLGTIHSLLFICLLYQVVNIIQEWIQARQQPNKFIVYTLPLFSMVVKIFILFIGFITIMSKLGFETKALTNVLSFCTLGISFAAKDTIQNIFGSFLIMMDRPFVIGDEIIACTIRGKVESVGLRATLLRTKEGSIVYIPNGKLADSQIDNMSKRTERIVSLSIPVSYTVSLERLTKFIEGLHKMATAQSLAKPDKTAIYIENMETQGFVIHFNVYLNCRQVQLEQAYRNQTILLILQLADQLQVQLGKEPH
ncbi:mechanosensitive ion channel family protein [Candidatus Cardinium hertigii]|uniref:Putative MscS family protein YkuT n=1 Tax=Candidatus Cardinium hertigii TaxID=247481 RepID=A0A2Z3LBQ1_9BACT|nr:mechanosensitive ion channel family protein [Candidatus Cardinium hertigii]AWN81376.1 putative MscS family protein YkuT [Candidatus Cardinium hertigii]